MDLLKVGNYENFTRHELSKTEKPNLRDLQKATNMPESTIRRQLSVLRDGFGMNIVFIRESTGQRGAISYYMLMDWGILDRSSFLNRYGKW